MKFQDNSWHIVSWLQKKKVKHQDVVRLDMSESDLFNLDIGKRGGDFFLGYFSHKGIKLALEKYGLYAELKNIGFDNVITHFDTTDTFKHKISVFDEARAQKNLLIELVLRKSYFKLKMPFEYKHNGKCYQCLTIDWLAMQNPDAEFTPRRPRLPGQKFPGLGLSTIVVELLMIACWRLRVAGLINSPGHYHNALLYSKIFYYLDPKIQAKLMVLKKTFKKMPLDKISWGIEWGCVKDVKADKIFSWMVGDQVVPLDDTLKKLFNSKKYKKYVNGRMKGHKFEFNEQKYQEMRKKMTVKNMEKII
jgi:hypothetical protein